MYDYIKIADRISSLAKQNKITIKDMMKDLKIGVNTLSNLRGGSSISSESLYKIADYLKTTTDYLLCRTDEYISTNTEAATDSMMNEMLFIFKSLNFADKLDCMQYVNSKVHHHG